MLEGKTKRAIYTACQLLVWILPVVLAADLIYLYAVGVWHDNYKVVEVIELVTLSGIIAVFGFNFTRLVIKAKRDGGLA